MTKNVPETNPEVRMTVAGVLTWLLPGAGHIFIGHRVRGLIIMVTIAVTFWGGVAIGGVKKTIDPKEQRLWFIAQICAGGHSLAALGIGTLVKPREGERESSLEAYGRAADVASVYTAICGMLNILVIFDVLVRAEKPPAQAQRGPPLAKGAAG